MEAELDPVEDDFNPLTVKLKVNLKDFNADLEVSPWLSNKFLSFIDKQQQVVVLDADDPQEPIYVSSDGVQASVSPTGKLACALGRDIKTLKIYDIETKEEMKSCQLEDPCCCVCDWISPTTVGIVTKSSVPLVCGR